MPKLSNYEENLIKEHYETGDFNWLAKTLNKEKNTITEWARKRGLKRKINTRRKGDMTPLLSNTLESFYWLGFIASDGYISKDGHFMLSQGEKDKDRVYLLANYLNTKVYEFLPTSGYSERTKTYRVNILDSKIGKIIRNMFGLKDNQTKTKTSIKLDFIQNENQAISFLLGLVDGDGYINKIARIQCDKSWHKTFENLIKLLPINYQNCALKLEFKKQQQDYYTTFYVKTQNTKELFKFAQDNNIPISPRKWKSLS